jgi:hypothetical protein
MASGVLQVQVSRSLCDLDLAMEILNVTYHGTMLISSCKGWRRLAHPMRHHDGS